VQECSGFVTHTDDVTLLNDVGEYAKFDRADVVYDVNLTLRKYARVYNLHVK